MPPKTHQLVIRNDDDTPFAIDCLFDPSSAPFLAVGETPTSLEPGTSASVEVAFFPRDAGKARASIPFQINGMYTVHVDVSGEGVPLRVELANPEDASVNFGSLREEQSCAREIKIANRGKLPGRRCDSRRRASRRSATPPSSPPPPRRSDRSSFPRTRRAPSGSCSRPRDDRGRFRFRSRFPSRGARSLFCRRFGARASASRCDSPGTTWTSAR